MLWTVLFLGIAHCQRVELINPLERFAQHEVTLPPPGFPVLQTDFKTPPDCGEDSYQGNGRLQGLNALITGGDSGIGRATVIAFAREGANVAINYLPGEEPDAQSLEDLLAGEELALTRIPGDLNNETFCGFLVEETARRLGGLDVLIGNAGFSSLENNGQSITNISAPEFERVFRTNVFANVYLSRAAVPFLPPGGSIVFTASAIVANPQPLAMDYGASKAAITYLMRCLALQLASSGIRVNAVAPGLTLTPFLATQGIRSENITLLVAGRPYERILQPAEIAPAYVDLVDPRKTAVTGEVFSATGGEGWL